MVNCIKYLLLTALVLVHDKVKVFVVIIVLRDGALMISAVCI